MAGGVAVLFARSDSCYVDLAGAAMVWDVVRDARGYCGSWPVVAHPPCRGWGRMRHVAKPRDDERALALFAVEAVRRWGGVLEHPHASALWAAAGLPRVGAVDEWGGFTLLVDQGWWGHPAPKPTWLYVVGRSREGVPALPVQMQRAQGRTVRLTRADRERTPVALAEWLLELAGGCAPGVRSAGAVTSSWRRGVGADKRAAFRQWAEGGAA